MTVHSIAPLAVFILLTLSACSGEVDPPAATPSDPPAQAVQIDLATAAMEAEETAVIDSAIAAVMERHPDVPAMYIGVWDPARGMYQQAYGLADTATERAASVSDHFRIGSISKTFMATVMLQLVDEGLLALDDTVAAVDADLAERHPALSGITIEQLLGMTSGIPDYMNVPNAAVAILTTVPDTVWTSDQLIGYGADGDVQPPGTPGYSTTNYIALQEIAESLTGQTIQELIAERVTAPLGMADTALPPDDDTTLPEPVSHGYMSPACIVELLHYGAEPVEPGTETTDWSASYGQSGGGMHSTLADLGVWAASNSGSALLSDERAADREAFHDAGLDILEYGLGLIRFGPQVGHEGEAIGWEGWAGRNPETGLVAVVFTNTCASGAAVFAALAALDPAFDQHIKSLTN